ncbi:MAG: hypothetical protein C0613_08615 [Desulfobulbaceae bacterium]|nr:MAG: hypothetical protein C0613_08615 [Desulfobulbaceae bacterium]
MRAAGRLAWYERLLVADYYLAALLLLVAGLLKVWNKPELSELLLSLYELEILPFQVVLAIDRWQVPVELIIGTIALYGWQARKMAWLLAAIYLLFSGAIALASQGYLLLPIYCGCFGAGDAATPALVLILRNVMIAVPLLFFSRHLQHYTLCQRFRTS